LPEAEMNTDVTIWGGGYGLAFLAVCGTVLIPINRVAVISLVCRACC
jgi:hypothetical protein